MEKKRTKGSDIDPQAVIDSFREDDPTPRYPPQQEDAAVAEKPPVPKEDIADEPTKDESKIETRAGESRRRKAKPSAQDYEGLFVRDSPVAARTGKMVYIRKEFHRNIQKIIQVIGDNEISLAAYVDNVLAHHFEMFQDEIDELYNRKLKEYGKFEK
jgi:hypothetical protein